MRPDPKPNHGLALSKPERPPADSDANRIDRRFFTDSFEIDARMPRIRFPDLIVLTCQTLDAVGEPPKT